MILMLAALALGATPAPEAPSAPGAFPYEVIASTLDNGLQLYLVPMPSPGVVAYYSWVRVGSRDEVDPGRTGFAHFFEHLMFKGSEAIPEEQRAKRLVRLGVEGNAWTWWDETAYHYLVSTEGLAELITLEADRFQHLALTADQVQREAGAVYGELRKSKAAPEYGLSLALYDAAYTTHTYQHDTLGYEADIADMPTAHAYAQTFFDRYYRPENVHIVVAGDVEPQAVKALVEQAYAGWPRAAEAPPPVPVEPEQTELREVTVQWSAPTAPYLSLGWKIPAYAPDSATTAALEVAGEYLLSPVGPLQRRIVQEEGLAYAVWGGTSQQVDPGLFTIEAMATDPGNLERIEAIVREELAVLASGVDAERLAATQTHARYAFLASLDDPATVASGLGWSLRRSQRADVLDVERASLAAVTPQAIGDAVRTYFVDSHLTRARLLAKEAE